MQLVFLACGFLLAFAMGFNPRATERSEAQKANSWLRMAVDLAFPRLIGTVSNRNAAAADLARERKATRVRR